MLIAIERGAQLAVAWGSAEKVASLFQTLIDKGLTLEQINEELAAHVELSRTGADEALRAKGA